MIDVSGSKSKAKCQIDYFTDSKTWTKKAIAKLLTVIIIIKKRAKIKFRMC